jgi:hypothetical protein
MFRYQGLSVFDLAGVLAALPFRHEVARGDAAVVW